MIVGDIVLSPSRDELKRILAAEPPPETVELKVLRGGAVIDLTVAPEQAAADSNDSSEVTTESTALCQ